jgi:hypothetical protein
MRGGRKTGVGRQGELSGILSWHLTPSCSLSVPTLKGHCQRKKRERRHRVEQAEVRAIVKAAASLEAVYKEATLVMESEPDVSIPWAFPMMDTLMSEVENFENRGIWGDHAVQQLLAEDCFRRCDPGRLLV